MLESVFLRSFHLNSFNFLSSFLPPFLQWLYFLLFNSFFHFHFILSFFIVFFALFLSFSPHLILFIFHFFLRCFPLLSFLSLSLSRFHYLFSTPSSLLIYSTFTSFLDHRFILFKRVEYPSTPSNSFSLFLLLISLMMFPQYTNTSSWHLRNVEKKFKMSP
jgi:hypothetical protein